MSNNPEFTFQTGIRRDEITLVVSMSGRSESFKLDGMAFDMNPASQLPQKYAVYHNEYADACDRFNNQRAADAQVD